MIYEYSKTKDDENISHLAYEGKITCIPVLILGTSYPIAVEWKDFKRAFGGGLRNWLSWCMFKPNDTAYEYLIHVKYESKKICHKWNGNVYLYHV